MDFDDLSEAADAIFKKELLYIWYICLASVSQSIFVGES